MLSDRPENFVVQLLSLMLLPWTASAREPPAPVTITILGDSRTNGCPNDSHLSECRKSDLGFNQDVLAQLLGLVAKEKPGAVFFTGDLTLGLEAEDPPGKLDEGATPAAKDWRVDFEYDSKAFQRMLTAFKKVVDHHLGKIPFHPVVGNHDSVGPDAISIFRKTFDIHNPKDLDDPAHLAYAVDLGHSAFIILATDFYRVCPKNPRPGSTCQNDLQEHGVSLQELAWLERELIKHSGKRLFVLGHEPAFSHGPRAVGLDHDIAARDLFWKLLQDYGVTAYLCSHQHELDISQHGGVWQIISGGAGAPLSGVVPGSTGAPPEQCTGGAQVIPAYSDRSFHHFVRLTLPPKSDVPPIAEVVDCANKVRTRTELTSAIPTEKKTVN